MMTLKEKKIAKMAEGNFKEGLVSEMRSKIGLNLFCLRRRLLDNRSGS
jgi:hypothetical protein